MNQLKIISYIYNLHNVLYVTVPRLPMRLVCKMQTHIGITGYQDFFLHFSMKTSALWSVCDLVKFFASLRDFCALVWNTPSTIHSTHTWTYLAFISVARGQRRGLLAISYYDNITIRLYDDIGSNLWTCWLKLFQEY